MTRMSLLARSGLWRLTRHKYVRRFYQRLEKAGAFVTQLDRLDRPTTRLDGTTDVDLDATTIAVVRATERCPEELSDVPLAPSDRIILARRAGEPVGWCCLSNRRVYVPELRQRLTFPGSYLWRLHVTPAERGRGIGTAIIRQAVKHSRTKLDAETITALVAPDNLPSRKAFEGLGFAPTERYTSGGCLHWEWHRRVLTQ